MNSDHAPKSEAKIDPFNVRLFFPQYIDDSDTSDFAAEEKDEDDPAEDQVKPQVIDEIEVVEVKMEQPDVQLGVDAAPDPKKRKRDNPLASQSRVGNDVAPPNDVGPVPSCSKIVVEDARSQTYWAVMHFVRFPLSLILHSSAVGL